MSVMDDFNRAKFDSGNTKYNRALFGDITIDEWVSLVEGFRAKWQRALDNAMLMDLDD
jgi:hypothetical protein